MLRWRIFGNNPYTSGSGIVPRVKIIPYTNVGNQTDITVGVVAVSTGLPGGLKSKFIRFRNLSTSGQQIRIGGAGVSIAGAVGTLLYPGEEWTLQNYDPTNATVPLSSAIADAAGAILNAFYAETLL